MIDHNNAHQTHRYSGPPTRLYSYMTHFSVECPKCGKEALVMNQKNEAGRFRTLVCSNCSHIEQEVPGKTYVNVSVGDPIFNLPLWLQGEFKGDVLWACNREHLGEIRNYVASKLRERQTLTHTTMVEKLPQFIKAAKNREGILKFIDKLLRK